MNRGRKEATGDGKGGAHSSSNPILPEPSSSRPLNLWGYRVQGWRKSTNLKGERWRRGERLSVPGEEGLNNRAARGGVMVSTSSGGVVCVECGWQAMAV